MQIAIALITLLACGGFLWWFKRDQNKSRLSTADEEEERALASPVPSTASAIRQSFSA